MPTTEDQTVTGKLNDDSPVPLGTRLARVLLSARDSAGLTSRRLAEHLGWDESKISRIINGHRVPTLAETRAWLTACSVDGEAAQAVIDLARAASRIQGKTSSLVPETRTYARLLLNAWEKASTARFYACSAMPVLLATEEYSAALATRDRGFAPQDLARAQARLVEGSVTCTVILEAGTLYTRLVAPQHMNTQLARLVELNQYPNVHIGVIPRTTSFPSPSTDFAIVDRTVLVPLVHEPLEFTTKYEFNQHSREFAAAEQAALFGAEATKQIAQALAATGA